MASSNGSLTEKQTWFLDQLAKGNDTPEALDMAPNVFAAHVARLQTKGYLNADGSVKSKAATARRSDAREAGIAAATTDSDVEVLFSMDEEVLATVEGQLRAMESSLDTLGQAITLHKQRGEVIGVEIERLQSEAERHSVVVEKLDQQRVAMREALDRLVAVSLSGQ